MMDAPRDTEVGLAAPSDKPPVLAVDHLEVSFPRFGLPEKRALTDISLDIVSGENVGVVGESGSGKTLLARSIMQLVPEPGRISSGTVTFNGLDLGNLGPEQLRQLRGRDMAMVISNPKGELDPLQTVGTQIGNILRYHTGMGKAEIRQRVLELLESVRIPDPKRRINAYPHELSGGMAQRVVMAIALACNPRFIISDDATSGLDVTVQTQVLKLLAQLMEERGAAMLFITRDIAITAHFCDRIAVLYDGQIVEVGRRETFFDNPRHPYTVLLLASFAHNDRLRRYWLGETRGQPAALARQSSGCAFAGRCVKAKERCFSEAPPLAATDTDHFVRCFYPIER